MGTRTEGTFEVAGFVPVEATPLVAVATAMPVGVATMEKRYSGGVDGVSSTLFSGGQATDGSGTYVAVESFEGALDGRRGAFVFVHAASTHGEDRYAEHFAIAEGSGTGDLTGISGTGGMTVVADGTHRVWFDWTLPGA